MTYTAEEIEKLLAAGALERIGMGSRRACYRLPDGRHCLKCYRSDTEIAEGKYPGVSPVFPLSPVTVFPLSASTIREISARRFDERRNTSCQEYRYWLELKKRLPSGLMAAFPSEMEQVLLPSRGWALVEELVLNADGSTPRKFVEEWVVANSREREGMVRAYSDLGAGLSRHAVRFYDPPNIAVQRLSDGSSCLRVTDFEPASRLFLPIDTIPCVARSKVRRRFAHYLRNWGIAVGRLPGNDGSAPISMSFSVSDNYSQHLAVVLASVLVNNPSSRFVFHVLHRDISEANQSRIRELEWAYPACEVKFHRIDASMFEKLPLPPALEHVTRETYYRYILPDVLVGENRTIYSDVDVLCVGELRPLWEMDMKGCVLAAVSEGKSGEFKKKLIGLEGDSPYFYSGLLLMDLSAMREGGYVKRLFETTASHADRFAWPDQDAINMTFRGRILQLGPEWDGINVRYSPFRRGIVIWHFPGWTLKPWCNIWKNITWIPYLKYLLESPYRANAVRFVLGHVKGFFYFCYTKKHVTRHLVCGVLVWKKKEVA